MTDLVPMSGRLLVEPIKMASQTAGGILLPTKATEKPTLFAIVVTWPDAPDELRKDPEAQVIVQYMPGAGFSVAQFDDHGDPENLMCLDQNEVIAWQIVSDTVLEKILRTALV